MEIDIEKFITEVYTRDVLWDQKNKNYHNRLIVEKNWNSIEAEMGYPKEQLKKKWKGMRDQFRYEMKKIAARFGESGIVEEQCDIYTTWPYFKSLLFLKDHMRARTSNGNLTHFIVKTEALTDEISNNENLDDSSTSSTEHLDYSQDSEEATGRTTNKKQKKNSDAAAELLAVEQRKLQLLEKKMDTQKERNDDEAFFYSLIPYMTNMDMKRKMLCRTEIQKAVYKYAFPSPSNEASISQNLNGYIIANFVDSSKLQWMTYVPRTSPVAPKSHEQD